MPSKTPMSPPDKLTLLQRDKRDTEQQIIDWQRRIKELEAKQPNLNFTENKELATLQRKVPEAQLLIDAKDRDIQTLLRQRQILLF